LAIGSQRIGSWQLANSKLAISSWQEIVKNYKKILNFSQIKIKALLRLKSEEGFLVSGKERTESL